MTKAEKICDHVSENVKQQAVTLANAVLTMQKKIEQQIPIYEQMPLAQQVKVGTGETMLRANPATQEFRATVRDYAAALNSLNNILEENKEEKPESSSLQELQAKLKIV